MKKAGHLITLALILLLSGSLLASCGGDTSSESPSSIDSTDSKTSYYDADNFVTPSNQVTTTKLVTYEGPSIMKSSASMDVKVNGIDLFVYETRMNQRREFSWAASTDMTKAVIFDFEGKVHLDVTINEDVTLSSALLRPLVYGIQPSISGKVISFDLSSSGSYVLEYNDDPSTALQIFANPIETDPLTEEEAGKDSNVIYVGPGVYKADAFPIKDNTTIYLAGGSYVYGQFSAEGVKNVTIRGRGIVSGSIYSRGSSSEYTIPVVMRNVKNLTIEGVAFFDPAGWALHLWKCDGVLVDNVKIITARSNGDGISIQSCSNVEVSGGYVRSWDDSIVVKNTDQGSTSHINVHDVVIWTDLAQSMEVGYETYGPTMDDIVFQDITVVHAFHKAVISLHNCDNAHISNLVYKNITLEDGQMLGDSRDDRQNDYLLDFSIAYNAEWTQSGGARGSVDGVTVENVKVYSMADSIGGNMRGEDATSSINNVSIKGLEIAGKQAGSLSEIGTGVVTNEFVYGTSVTKMSKVTGSLIHLPYSLNLANEEVAKTENKNIEQEGLIVPDFARYTGEESFIGVKTTASGSIASSHGVGNKTSTPVSDGTGDFVRSGSSGNYAYDGNANTSYETGTWVGDDNEFAGLTYDFTTPITIGVLRIKGNPNNVYAYDYNISVWSRKLKSDGTMNANYTRLITPKSYTMSPSNGNIIDINLPTQEFGGIQLRLYREDDIASPSYYSISEIEFYPPSLTFGKAIVDSTEHNDVYPVTKLVDGDPTGTSYYESKKLPATVVIDLEDVYKLSKLVLCLPPILTWSKRTQAIEVSVSDSLATYDASTTSFTTVKERTDYVFDPTQGNRVMIDLDDVPCRFLKLVIFSNDANGGYGAQLSEVSAYGVK
ncbi:MAG: glycosyl hydrolase family 28 protein [Bacilli bacterium]|jgi:hypothetical protein|nr:glycosyl hydrolase family 28 protein [Bacilli bacterium]